MVNDEVEFDLTNQEPLSLDEVSFTVLAKGLALRDAHRPRLTAKGQTRMAVVVGSTGEEYSILLGLDEKSVPVWTLCSCPWGQRHMSGRVGCSHQVAALMEYNQST